MATMVQVRSPREPAVELAANLAAVRRRVDAAAARAGRDPAGITVVAVSKTVPLERLRGAPAAGITDLGENRVQEAAAKVAALGGAITWHLVGHVQRNKARAAVELFDLIHSVDSVALAGALDRHAAARGKRQRVLLQVNVTGEATKGGFTPEALRTAAAEVAALPHVQPEGLMTMAPLGAADDEVRAVFRALRALHRELAPAFGAPWRHLSMGMTDDFEIAVEEGASLVRIGRAIFGERAARVAGNSGN